MVDTSRNHIRLATNAADSGRATIMFTNPGASNGAVWPRIVFGPVSCRRRTSRAVPVAGVIVQPVRARAASRTSVSL